MPDDTPDRVALGRAIEERRLRAGLTIGEAVARSGVSRTTWRDVEKARGSFPSRLILQAMADALSAPRADLLRLAGYEWGDEDEPSEPASDIAELRDEVAELREQMAELLRRIPPTAQEGP